MVLNVPPSPYCQALAHEGHSSTTIVSSPVTWESNKLPGWPGKVHVARTSARQVQDGDVIQLNLKAAQEAQWAEKHMSTAQDFRLNMLCDASVPQDSQAGVSYACTFKKY